MPYITPELRVALEFLNPLPANAGELNYAISHMVHRYILDKCKNGLSYQMLNEVVGVMDCAKLEFYRTVVVPYEKTKSAANGPVSSLDAAPEKASALTADDILTALRAGISTSPAKQPAKEDLGVQLTPAPASKPPAAEPAKQPATSATRRPAQVIGTSPITGEEAPPNTPVARAPVVVPKGHTPAKVDRHVQSVWDRAGQGNGEEDVDI